MGYQLIRISDDGVGMIPDDALLAIERHATAKIKQVEDIHNIGTMGFRGEALPSIGSVSKMTLTTTPRKSPSTNEASLIVINGGKLTYTASSMRDPGTTIEVKNLFFNVPARKKFQGSTAASLTLITKTLQRIALAYPEVKFSLINNEKPHLILQKSTEDSFKEQLRKRISQILGKEFVDELIYVKSNDGLFEIEGFVASPQIHKPNKNSQFTYINKRHIRSKAISEGVLEGFGTRLPSK